MIDISINIRILINTDTLTLRSYYIIFNVFLSDYGSV